MPRAIPISDLLSHVPEAIPVYVPQGRMPRAERKGQEPMYLMEAGVRATSMDDLARKIVGWTRNQRFILFHRGNVIEYDPMESHPPTPGPLVLFMHLAMVQNGTDLVNYYALAR